MKGVEIPCSKIVEWVTDFLEGVMPAETARLFEEHLAVCEGCRRYLDQIRATQRALGTVSDETLSPQAWRELRAAFRDLSR